MTVFFDPQLEKKPDFVRCMERIYAWYDHEVLDRVPVRFSAHNAEFDTAEAMDRWPTLKDRWYDTEHQIQKVLETVEKGEFFGRNLSDVLSKPGAERLCGHDGRPA